jgi:hypothetical protein
LALATLQYPLSALQFILIASGQSEPVSVHISFSLLVECVALSGGGPLMMAGVALGVKGVQLMLHFLLFNGLRRNLPMSK